MSGDVSADMGSVADTRLRAAISGPQPRKAMISIRRLLDLNPAAEEDADLRDRALRLKTLLNDALTSWRLLKRDLGSMDFRAGLRRLLNSLEISSSPEELAAIASDALSIAQQYICEEVECSDEHRAHMQSIISLLTRVVGDLTGQTDASVARLQNIERQIQRASAMDDLRPLKARLAECLAAVREAAAEQKRATLATVERLQEHIRRAPQPPVSVAPELPFASAALAAPDYIAAFKLQHAEHIARRFGETARDQMLSIIAAGLESAGGAGDRLMRWKGASFLMFVTSAETRPAVHRRISTAVAKIAQRYVELGKNSALLAVGVEWTLFSRAQFPSLDLGFALVDGFLKGRDAPESTSPSAANLLASEGKT